MSWTEELKDSISSIEELLVELDLPLDLSKVSLNQPFKIKVPRSFVQRMKKNDWNDPLLLQVLPSMLEESTLGDRNPLMEDAFSLNKGLLQKFSSRVLFITSSHCAIHCRYCFRRFFPYEQHRFSIDEFKNNLELIEKDPLVKEIILSGGDPLSLKDNHLQMMFDLMQSVKHLRSIRIHTRFPVVIPSRLTPELLKVIQSSKLPVVIVLHINHPAELDHGLALTLNQWKKEGVTFLNQAVLLKNINDKKEVLEELQWRCLEAGVLPYYLHQFDDVASATHFHVDPNLGLELIDQLTECLPGYLVPKYVKELPYATSKVPVKNLIS